MPVNDNISLRNYFAGQALGGLCSNPARYEDPYRNIAFSAFKQADAMIAEGVDASREDAKVDLAIKDAEIARLRTEMGKALACLEDALSPAIPSQHPQRVMWHVQVAHDIAASALS